MRDTGTRKEASAPPPRHKLQQPRSPKFRKKGSRNNKTYRGPAALRLSTLEDEPEKERGEWRTGGGKGDTFHFTRDTFPPGSLPHSPTCIGESERIRSHVSRAAARERLEAAPLSRSARDDRRCAMSRIGMQISEGDSKKSTLPAHSLQEIYFQFLPLSPSRAPLTIAPRNS